MRLYWPNWRDFDGKNENLLKCLKKLTTFYFCSTRYNNYRWVENSNFWLKCFKENKTYMVSLKSSNRALSFKTGFHMSGKSQTVWDFTVSRPSQILPTNEIVDIPDRLGWTRTNLEDRERFYFPDASQISAMVGDHSRQIKTQICTVEDVGVRRRWI